ncbi:restriction endonuclease subunit S [bacterium]|nr:restriction endonuclease subunit S [bacterium]
MSISDLVDNSHISNTKECISNYAKNNCFSFEPFVVGSMLMSFKLTIGKTSIVDFPCYCNEAIMKFEPFINNDIFRKYLFSFIGFLSQKIKVTNAIKGSTLNKKKLARMLVPLPPLEEQERIVAKIKKLEPLVSQYERLRQSSNNLDSNLIQKLRLSIIKAAIEGTLVKQDLEDLSAKNLVNEISKEKEDSIKSNDYINQLEIANISHKKLYDICKLETGSLVVKTECGSGLYPVISGGKIPMGFIDKFNFDGQNITVARCGGAGYVSWHEGKI